MDGHVLIFKEHAKCWTEAFPLGNGTIGAMVYGNPMDETIMLNHESLWSGYPQNYHNEDAYKYLPKVRQLLKNGKEYKAQRLMEEHMAGRFTESFMPAGSIHIKQDTLTGDNEYIRQLDMEKALVCWQYGSAEQKQSGHCFINQPHQTLVYKLEGKRRNIEISLDSVLKHTRSGEKNYLYLTGRAPSHVVPHYWECEAPIQYKSVNAEKGMQYAIMISVKTDGSIFNYGEKMAVQNATWVVLYVNIETSFAGFKKHPELEGKDFENILKVRNANAEKLNYEELFQEHLQEYLPLYRKNKLEITEVEEKKGQLSKELPLAVLLYHFGRYLLLSSSRKCQEPANLQGIWNREIRPYWSCNYTTNINVEMNYWPAEVCNLSECVEPLIKMISETAQDGYETARIHYGCRGWTMHHNVDIWRRAIPAGTDVPVYGFGTSLFWCMAAGWMCRHLWEHYLFTQDMIFLKNVAEPLIEGAVDFYLDWMVKKEDGNYTTCPATSPENSFIDENKKKCSITSGSTMDSLIIRDTFQYYVKMYELLKKEKISFEDESRFTTVKEDLEHLPFPKCDKDGRILEWEAEKCPAEPGHRHHSPLYGVYPANVIEEENTELWHGSYEFLSWKLKNKSSESGWSLAWTMCLLARMKKEREFENELNKFLNGSLYPNLFTLHPPLSEKEWEVFQIDAVFGYTAAVAECLVQSHKEKIELLPCLPPSWKKGSIQGICARGGYILDIFWEDGKLTKVVINGKKGNKLLVQYRGIKKNIIFICDKMVLDSDLNVAKSE